MHCTPPGSTVELRNGVEKRGNVTYMYSTSFQPCSVTCRAIQRASPRNSQAEFSPSAISSPQVSAGLAHALRCGCTTPFGGSDSILKISLTPSIQRRIARARFSRSRSEPGHAGRLDRNLYVIAGSEAATLMRSRREPWSSGRDEVEKIACRSRKDKGSPHSSEKEMPARVPWLGREAASQDEHSLAQNIASPMIFDYSGWGSDLRPASRNSFGMYHYTIAQCPSILSSPPRCAKIFYAATPSVPVMLKTIPHHI
ncbi:uncharacterized protein MYCFIDRAFT_207999 [Pseudocercospora fijiensis CIRAD86]|uniref:Uncharacterized protein n=1 Tax=Pseudocercospora fijiensis (strain CIRAD86) TaxID=383855 RepID=M2ZSJ0_PSEFD|nr:uncharacterized protein MYCFIDRAFT_207999 [Pseudocercospora fijiensis CIRAD86]EME81984.1 hypothetical protein MYCFIDRAFT_207999 [Pseudocercospora fijiensis CIRAD86]